MHEKEKRRGRTGGIQVYIFLFFFSHGLFISPSLPFFDFGVNGDG